MTSRSLPGAFKPGISRAGLLLGALAIDTVFGELPEAVHPVVWMGRGVRPFERLRPGSPTGDLALGAAAVAVITSASALAGWGVARGRSVAWVVLSALLLKSSFAMRALFLHVMQVETTLEKGDLEAGQRAVGRIVSRETHSLERHQVTAAAIESLAENVSDSIVAPLIYYLVAGLPGALFYRAANTLDAQIGYRGEYEWFGRAAARLDDVLNIMPSRITALLTTVAAGLTGADWAGALKIALRDGALTPSPNAGKPMAAMAGALGVELEKSGVYVLGAGLRKPDAGDLRRALKVAAVTSALAVAFALALARVLHPRRAC